VDATPRAIMACKVIVADGMQITDLSDELRYCLTEAIRPPRMLPSYNGDAESGPEDFDS
jgi:hypothetical protein